MRARLDFVHDGATRPVVRDGTRVSPIRPTVKYGRARQGSLIHILDGAGCSLEGGRLLYAARWLCMDAAPDVVLIASAGSWSVCSRCLDRAEGAVVYRCFANDELLYVGSTVARRARQARHAKTSTWWPQMTRIEYQDCSSLAEARAVEAVAIRMEKPTQNRALRGAKAVAS